MAITFKKRSLPFGLMCVLSVMAFANDIQSTTGEKLQRDISELQRISTELKKNMLPLLSLIKEFEKNNQFVSFEVVKAIQPDITVREADNPSSSPLYTTQTDEEFKLLERRDSWIKIELNDGREGWIPDNQIQIFEKQELTNGLLTSIRGKNEARSLLTQMAYYEKRTSSLFLESFALIASIQDQYQKLSSQKKTVYEGVYKQFLSSKTTIDKYRMYVDRYYEPYRHLTEDLGEQKDAEIRVRRFQGDASINYGKSKYSAISNYSTTSRNIALNGVYRVSDKTSVNAGFHNQNEVIQTPFSNTGIGAGITSTAIKNLKVNAGFDYSKYSDKSIEYNSFSNTRGRLNLTYQVHQNASIFGNVNLMNKNFELDGGNDYRGAGIVVGTLINPDPQNHLRLQFRGNSQRSEINYLSFTQLNPQLYYSTKTSPQKTFSSLVDFDKMTYEESNGQNDFQKLKLNFTWKKRGSKKVSNRSFIISGKQFPNKRERDYVRAGIQTRSQKGSIKQGKTVNTSFASNFTGFLDRDSMMLKDFLDLRVSRSAVRRKVFMTVNLSTRIWNNFLDLEEPGLDHVFDFYTELGPIIKNISGGVVAVRSIKPGLIIGGHGLVNIDDDHILRNGNSARGGLSLQGNIGIHKGSLNLTGAYEHSFVISTGVAAIMINNDTINGGLIDEELNFRLPNSFRFKLDFTYPILKNWDINFRVYSYRINTDASTDTSANPLESRSGTRFSGGFLYRFGM